MHQGVAAQPSADAAGRAILRIGGLQPELSRLRQLVLFGIDGGDQADPLTEALQRLVGVGR